MTDDSAAESCSSGLSRFDQRGVVEDSPAVGLLCSAALLAPFAKYDH
jgi:hypothetical protein